MTEPRCRICGVGFKTGTQYFPEPLLPGDIPDPDEVCGDCRQLSVEWAEILGFPAVQVLRRH